MKQFSSNKKGIGNQILAYSAHVSKLGTAINTFFKKKISGVKKI